MISTIGKNTAPRIRNRIRTADGMRRLVSRSRLSCSQRTRGAKGDQPMRKGSRTSTGMEKPEITIGLDLGDRFSHYCMINNDGDVIETGRIQTTEAALRRHFEGEPTMRIALECGTHSPWTSRLLEQLGHPVIVANARKIRAITASESKN